MENISNYDALLMSAAALLQAANSNNGNMNDTIDDLVNSYLLGDYSGLDVLLQDGAPAHVRVEFQGDVHFFEG